MKKRGLTIIHSNRMEQLRDLCFAWLAENPLSSALVQEQFLTHSQGMKQWLELELARNSTHQIAAAFNFQLPLGFLWQMYRRVLGEEAVPRHSAFDRDELIWHLYRLLPELVAEHQAFAALRHFLQDHDALRRHQLALKLADLFDQYQVYRADWLDAWSSGKPILLDAKGEVQPIPEAHFWQFLLWEKLRSQLGEENHRAAIHPKFLQALQNPDFPADIFPERIVVFGVSSLPKQVIEALAAMAAHTHVLILLHNPCAFFWGDLQEDRAIIRRALRHQARPNYPKQIDFGDLHLYAQPLLASFGRQGRDFIALLDAYDQPEVYREYFAQHHLKIDLFDLDLPEHPSMLQQLQHDIATLEALPQTPEPRATVDQSIMIHVAHSPMREIEILHDQLLALFDDENLQLKPHEVMVMMPNVADYSPLIAAVFGAHRQIPFTIADQSERDSVPLLRLIDSLLDLPTKRCTIAEVLDFLRLEAFAKKFELSQDDLQILSPWLIEVGIRWGLDARHRASLDLPENAANTWQDGFERMLLGYASGHSAAWHDVEPFADVSGLQVEALGHLAEVLEFLQKYQQMFSQAATPSVWNQQISQFLNEAFLPQNQQELQCIERIQTTLELWLERCERAQLLHTAMDLTVVREVLNEAFLNSMSAAQFLGGAVNFGMMMPMRAIPFRVLAILGLNDRDFPRKNRQDEMDLMSIFYRAGDRAKRDEDRYLFLEAILSARDVLYLSYVGQDIHSNEHQPPSVVLAQCCDWLDARWVLPDGTKTSCAITKFHPLQAFSPKYFAPNSSFFSYVKAWEGVFAADDVQTSQALAPISGRQKWSILTAKQFLRQPSATFFRERLNIYFSQSEPLEEDEPFIFDALASHDLQRSFLDKPQLLLQFSNATELEQNELWEAQFLRLQRTGQLPHGAAGQYRADELRQDFAQLAATYAHLMKYFPEEAPAENVHFTSENGVIWHDLATNLRQNAAGELAFAEVLLGSCMEKNAKGEIKTLFLHRLLMAWVRHVLASAMGKDWATWIFPIQGDILCLAPLDTNLAQTILEHWQQAHTQALCAPLPVAIRTASAWLLAGEDLEKAAKQAAKVFDGDDFSPSERRQDAYLQRSFADFATMQAQDFPYWAKLLYEPMCHAILHATRIIKD